ncbi:MAG: metallophosphoesterase family protein, partial [Bryobacteraceae bacterium]
MGDVASLRVPRVAGGTLRGVPPMTAARSESRCLVMRLLLSSDWHLGRSLFHERLLRDQHFVLSQILAIAREEKPQALIVAGDIYDRAVPTPDAVELLDDILSHSVLDLQLDVVLLAGNHDSRERLSFAARLLERNRLHIAAARDPFRLITLCDSSGPLDILALSYLEPPEAREFLRLPDPCDHDAALRALIASARPHLHASRTIIA